MGDLVAPRCGDSLAPWPLAGPPRALGIHLTALVVVPACVVMAWWQGSRALGGNELSWAYAVEWPVFAGYGAYLWWKLIHETPGERAARSQASAALPGGVPGTVLAERSTGLGEAADWALVEDDGDQELAAYNRYLATLGAADDAKRR